MVFLFDFLLLTFDFWHTANQPVTQKLKQRVSVQLNFIPSGCMGEVVVGITCKLPFQIIFGVKF